MEEFIKDKTIIICENDLKISILKKITNTFFDIKFYTKNEFFNEYLFKYDERSLYYLIDNYNFKIDVAKMYLNNLKYINSNKVYNSSKLNFLVELKNELDENNLLIYNKEFIKEIKDYTIVVYNYPYLENYELEILNKLNAKIINDTGEYKLDKVYVFETMEEEINYVCKSISKLLLKGIDINKIKLMGVNENYNNDLYRLFKMYNIPIKIKSNNSLISNNIVKKFINSLNNGLDKAIELIKNDNSDIVNKIISICNKYVLLNNDDIKYSLIIDELKNTKIDNFKYKNYIDIVSLDSNISNDEYVFFLNFNNGFIPSIKKDEEYINDRIKEEINLKKTCVINKEIKEYEINKLKGIKNLVITAKLSDSTGECYLSPLVNELNLEIIKEKDNILESFSYNYDLIKLCKCEDNFNKYGTITEEYLIYKNNIKDNLYNTYDNKYTIIDSNSLKEYLHNKLTLSYSSLTNYNKCAFRYYLANILKLDKYEDTFESFIGSIFHDVLESSFKNNVSVEEEIENYIKKNNKELDAKERFYINKITKDIKFVIEVLNKQKEYTTLDNSLFEQNITIEQNNNIEVLFTGFIDKLLYKEEDDNTYISIIDYKTGNVETNLSYIPYGLNMQLPIYLYLVSKSNLFKNPKFAGFYIQYILDKDILRNSEKTYLEQYENNLKLVGYSNSNIHTLSMFDNTYENSSLIRSMRVKSDGNFYAYSKTLTDNEIEKIISVTENVIDNAINKILDGDFTINPKRIGYDEDVGCNFCKFRDICFRKENDYVIIPKSDNLDYLKEGEKDYAKVD